MPSSAWRTDVCSRSEEHTSELQSLTNLVCRLLLEIKKELDGIKQEKTVTEEFDALQENLSKLQYRKNELHDQLQKIEICIFFNDTATTEIYTLSLHDALPI